jgi:hypothetical protein
MKQSARKLFMNEIIHTLRMMQQAIPAVCEISYQLEMVV